MMWLRFRDFVAPHSRWWPQIAAALARIECGQQDLARRMDRLAQQVSLLTSQEAAMSQALDDLTAEVSSTSGTIDSAVALINGLADKVDALIAAGNNDPALAQLATDLRAKKDALAQAVADNPVPA